MRLAEIIKGLELVRVRGRLDIEVRGIAYNSKKVCPDFIFVAVEGLRLDGHSFIGEAISKGARAIVVSKDIDINGVTLIKVKDTRAALSSLSAAFFARPSEKLGLIGVTGTNGKTSVAYLIRQILIHNKERVGLIGSLGVSLLNTSLKTNHTTPESLELQAYFKDMVEKDLRLCVMEVSSHGLKLKRVNDCDFNIGVFTNLTHEHLDFHMNMENYYRAKRVLFLRAEDVNIINIDDLYGRRLLNDLSDQKAKLVSYGIEEKADLRAEDIRYIGYSSKFSLVSPMGYTDINLKLPGKYNIYNSLAAIACCLQLGMSLDQVKRGLEAVSLIPGRFERIWAEPNLSIIIDYAHTPDGFEQLLTTIDRTKTNRIIMVFGCVGERDKTKRKVMGQIVAKYSDECILTTDNCRSEDPREIISQIKEGFNKDTKYIEILDRAEAIRYAIFNSREGDTILITGKGHEHIQVIGNKAIYFNEKEIVKSALDVLLTRPRLSIKL